MHSNTSSFFCCLGRAFSGAGRSLKSAVQQSSVCRAAKVRLLHGKNCSARQQILMSDRHIFFS